MTFLEEEIDEMIKILKKKKTKPTYKCGKFQPDRFTDRQVFISPTVTANCKNRCINLKYESGECAAERI